MIKNLSLSLFLSLYAFEALSWGGIGHQTVGEIAERNLTSNAQTAITDILGPERLALSAIWPDDVRDDPDFAAFSPYHFISLDDAIYESLPDHEHAPKDSMTILKKIPDLLKDPNVPRSTKIVALKYLVHVVGDVHQPLHIGKKNDHGGNACKVQWDRQTVSLHQVWDGKIIEFDIARLKAGRSPLRVYNFINYAEDIIKTHTLVEGQLNLDFYSWIRESQLLRVNAYPKNAPQSFCKNDSTEFPLIDEDYKKSGALITEERIFLGGMRLAHLLNDIFKNGSNPGTNVSLSKKQILDQLNLTNY